MNSSEKFERLQKNQSFLVQIRKEVQSGDSSSDSFAVLGAKEMQWCQRLKHDDDFNLGVMSNQKRDTTESFLNIELDGQYLAVMESDLLSQRHYWS